ncbi:MAG: glycosyltransferase family 1 protein, partial [Patescibacteria group bacterium]|nr:glycosyltransferase family 1 protein [Patescibacteria group bacterium]
KNLLQSLIPQAKNHQFKLFLNQYKKTENNVINELAKHSNVKLYQYRFPNKFLNASFLFRKWPKIDELIHGCDVLFFPSMMYSAWSKKTKTVLTMHDLSYEIYPEFFTPHQQIWHKLMKPKQLCQEVDKVISVSESTEKDIISKYNIEQEKVHAIHSGIDDLFRPVVDNNKLNQARKKHNLPDKKFILQTGTIEPRKNHIATLASFEELHRQYPKEMQNTHLLFAGHNGWKSRTLIKKVYKSKVRDKIHIANEVALADMPSLYSLASVFSYPSFYEGFGFPVLEAFSCGVPVAASHTSSLGEIAQNACLLVNPYRIDELTIAIHQLLADPSLAKSMRAKGLARTVNFSWEKTAKQTLKVLESA